MPFRIITGRRIYWLQLSQNFSLCTVNMCDITSDDTTTYRCHILSRSHLSHCAKLVRFYSRDICTLQKCLFFLNVCKNVPDDGFDEPKYVAYCKIKLKYWVCIFFCISPLLITESGSSVSIVTGYGLDGPGIESRWGRDFPHLSRPSLGSTQPPVQWVPGLTPGVKSGRGMTLTPPHPFWCRGQERIQLYLYFPYGPYGLYRASVPVQGCTLPITFYSIN